MAPRRRGKGSAQPPDPRKRVGGGAGSGPKSPGGVSKRDGRLRRSTPKDDGDDLDLPAAYGSYRNDDDRLGFAFLTIVTACTYLPAVLYGDFIWDDEIWTESRAVRDWSGVWDIWFDPSEVKREVHYWPCVYTAFWLEHKLWGLEPLGYHAANVGLHIWNACLVRRVLRRIGADGDAAWLSAAVFAVHPARVESVAWVIERKDVLSGLFYLLSLWYHPSVCVDSVPDSREADRSLRTSLLFYVLAMLSKTIVVSLPVVLLLVPWMIRGRLSGPEFRRSVPFFVAGVSLALFDVRMARAGEPVDFGFNLAERALIASRAVCFYLWKLVWPVGLSVVYPRWELGEDAAVWAVCLLIVVTMGLAALYVLVSPRASEGWGPKARVPAASLVYFLATLFPVLCILDYGYMRYSYVADRFAYLASVGPVSLFSTAYVRAIGGGGGSGGGGGGPAGRAPARILAGLILAVLASLAYRQSFIYESDESFYGHVTRLNPKSSMWTNLGNVYMRMGGERDSDALDCYERSYALDPRSKKLHANYGLVLRRMGRAEEAARIVGLGVEVEEEDGAPRSERKKTLNEMGNAVSDLGRHDEAAAYFRRAVELDPGYKIGWQNLGNELLRAERFEESFGAYGRAIGIDPGYVNARINMALGLAAVKRWVEAAEQLREVLRRNPGHRLAKERLDAVTANM